MTAEEAAYNEALLDWGLRFRAGALEHPPEIPPGVHCPCIHCRPLLKAEDEDA